MIRVHGLPYFISKGCLPPGGAGKKVATTPRDLEINPHNYIYSETI